MIIHGHKRQPRDFYPTPPEFCAAAVRLLGLWSQLNSPHILDAGAGTGNWGLAVKAVCPSAHLTGVDLRVGAIAECSPRGAALAGLLGLGLLKSLDEIAAAPREEVVYRPAMPPDDVERLFAGWRHAVRQVLVARENQT